MIAILFIVIFLFFGWLGLMFPLTEYDAIHLTLCIALGLTAVVITGFAMIINRLDILCEQKSKRDNEKKDDSSETKNQQK